MNPNHWDERYSQPGYAYGTKPNEFLASVTGQIPAGRVLTIGEGEGRNAIFLAGLGHEVVAVDQSAVGLAKLRQRAGKHGLRIETVQADLREYVIEPSAFSGIVSIFCHLPPAIRVPLHAAIARGLRPGGVFILEACTPSQLGRGTGGPSSVDMLPAQDLLERELPGLSFVHAMEVQRDGREGTCQTGMASAVQLVARETKPIRAREVSDETGRDAGECRTRNSAPLA